MDDQLFHVTPFEHRPGDGERVIFLVEQPDAMREVIVERDESGLYEMVVDGDGYYDAEHEPLDLTLALIDTTEVILAAAERARIDAYAFVHRMFAVLNGWIH